MIRGAMVKKNMTTSYVFVYVCMPFLWGAKACNKKKGEDEASLSVARPTHPQIKTTHTHTNIDIWCCAP